MTPQQARELGFAHLHLPTTDFLFAPPLEELHRGCDFMAGACFGLFGVWVVWFRVLPECQHRLSVCAAA